MYFREVGTVSAHTRTLVRGGTGTSSPSTEMLFLDALTDSVANSLFVVVVVLSLLTPTQHSFRPFQCRTRITASPSNVIDRTPLLLPHPPPRMTALSSWLSLIISCVCYLIVERSERACETSF